MTARLRHVAAVTGAVAMLLSGAGCTGGEQASSDAAATSPPTTTTAAASKPSADVLGPGRGMARYNRQQVDWADCGDGFQCATVLVPVDYDDPTGAAVGLAVNRLPAADPSARIGSLLVDPGGPGASGVDFVRQDASTLFATLHTRYDLVGFDPRGVGASQPVECVDTAGLDALFAVDPDPDTVTELAETTRLFRSFGRDCRREAPALLAHMSTTDVARDLDVIRAVVGDDRLHYLGFSYGTLIGSVYAELYPDRVARMVLDGAVDPTLDYQHSILAQAGGFETALRAYAADCVTGPGCPLGSDVDTGLKRVRQLVDDLDATPMPTGDPDRPLTEGLGVYGIISPLYSRSLWTALTLALKSAMEDGDGSQLLALADLYAERTDDGYTGNLFQGYTAVSCLDDPARQTVNQVVGFVDRLERASPTLGRTLESGLLACSQWPVEAADPLPAAIDAAGAAPIVVVGTTRDPATPYAQAQALADQLDSGVLLSRDGDGHTAYGSGNACIDSAVDDYLLDGVVPSDGTLC